MLISWLPRGQHIRLNSIHKTMNVDLCDIRCVVIVFNQFESLEFLTDPESSLRDLSRSLKS